MSGVCVAGFQRFSGFGIRKKDPFAVTIHHECSQHNHVYPILRPMRELPSMPPARVLT
jgi:hypothetical protein